MNNAWKNLNAGTLPYFFTPYPSSTMSASTRSILIGGWAAFAEDNGVNTKEPVENFDWMPSESDKRAYVDCRNALDRAEVGRKWLKAYTCAKGDFPFSCSMADEITGHMWKGHSGGSMICLLWSYKSLLNDWDKWVFLTKKEHYRRLYKDRQIQLTTCYGLLALCDDPRHEQHLRQKCAQYGLARDTVLEIKAILEKIRDDHTMIEAEEAEVKKERYQREMVESLEFLYDHPMRWFDTPHGCSLSPGSLANVNSEALGASIDEMEFRHPGYMTHIHDVENARCIFNRHYRTDTFSNFSEEGSKLLEQFMRDMQLSTDRVRLREEKERQVRQDLVECLEFLYKQPMRWFDTEYGCSLHPGSPSSITPPAMREMEMKHPGYKQHIAAVVEGIQKFNREKRTDDFCNMSQPGMAVVEEFMRANGIVVA